MKVTLITNKKAHFDFELSEKYEAGLELLGGEVKSLRNKRGELVGAHIVVRGGEMFVVNMEIPPYQASNTAPDYDPTRTRRLLMHKKEIRELEQKTQQKGLTIIPISLYDKGRVLKMEIAIARGKKKFDKRETIKRRDSEKELGRTLKK